MDKETDGVIKQYRERLIELGIVPEEIIVFGSHASGQAGSGSDLDLLVVASSFEGMDLWERLSLLGRARAGIVRPMEILGITPAEAEGPDLGSFLRHEVLEKGLRVA
jgi:predicted nucleotidyltransferase